MREPLPAQVRPQPVPVAESEAPPAPVPPAPGSAAILQLADLPAEQRKQLPPLRISMHMWDQDPARRFVIIDGARLHEGDRVGDAVIEQITSDSVLLDWNGRHLRLPLLR
ncbi:MAG: general secretion pathway protein GspB [Gammaproteobacteria bacterium]|nr:general secretion pathway protein GspB [Gammaproteobacteria bacterium]